MSLALWYKSTNDTYCSYFPAHNLSISFYRRETCPLSLPFFLPMTLQDTLCTLTRNFPIKRVLNFLGPGAEEVPPWPLDISMANGFRCVFPVLDSLF